MPDIHVTELAVAEDGQSLVLPTLQEVSLIGSNKQDYDLTFKSSIKLTDQRVKVMVNVRDSHAKEFSSHQGLHQDRKMKTKK